MTSYQDLVGDADVVVTDGGLETWLLFERGFDLPAFAAYPLVDDPAGRRALQEYYSYYLDIAAAHDAPVQLEAPTWRANPDWAATLGHDRAELARHVDRAVGLVAELRDNWSGDRAVVVGGAVGPRGDGYVVGATMDAATAADYHSHQAECLATSGADVLTAMTIGYVDEAVGIARAAERAGLPAIISFTVETDGRLPSGTALGEAITATDDATSGSPVHYMVNCAHPTHFDHVLDADAPWIRRIGGLRANASSASHAELDEATELDAGDPDDLAARYADLRSKLPALRLAGGCCGTDHRHVAAIVSALSSLPDGATPARS
jgi:homocysteine S-methyltransferase